MKVTIENEEKFQAKKNQFMVGPSQSGYTLAYSATGVDFTDYDLPTPAGENLIVNGAVQYGWFKLKGNSGEVTVVL